MLNTGTSQAIDSKWGRNRPFQPRARVVGLCLSMSPLPPCGFVGPVMNRLGHFLRLDLPAGTRPIFPRLEFEPQKRRANRGECAEFAFGEHYSELTVPVVIVAGDEDRLID